MYIIGLSEARGRGGGGINIDRIIISRVKQKCIRFSLKILVEKSKIKRFLQPQGEPLV